MKIYFAGSITGGREKVNDYIKIVSLLENYGEVLTKHVADINLTSNGEDVSAEDVYLRDTKLLNECDILVGDLSIASLGVGFEFGYAECKNKKIICLYDKNKRISKLLIGNKNYIKIDYTNIEECLDKLKNVLDNI